ncbi:MAG: undecaprenyldiphospho-muramoylpentapeptide beta-N-acetylglucosaminyltransferase [Betaproteobacteria bacterium]|jgi:UDP-N-acetylglucosamine--N-acetylmuramyl-(pentapeptide) pyrophosphoryl-undecaprenol N-acetylglucosamine transferase
MATSSRSPSASPLPSGAGPTLLVMAGGTGGHIMPALAVARELRGRGWRIVWLGSRNGMEADLVPRHGFALEFIRFAGLRGKGLARMALLPVNLLVAFWQCLVVLRRVRPDVVLGMGGYISFPGGLMAALLRRPLVLHEQNAIAGLANRVLARVASRRLTGFPRALPDSEWCGNPVRSEILALPEPEARFAGRSGPLRLLVVGGSLGAQALNETVPQALAALPAAARPLVRHQAGTRHLAALQANYAAAGVPGECVAFIDDMAAALGEADCVICRAGALTVAELAAAGVASVLVPFPYAVDDHQTANGRFLADGGAAVLIPQRDLSAAGLATLIAGFTRDRLLDMARLARGLGRADAARRVADVCQQLAVA